MYRTYTDKQKKTLILFAQGLTVLKIAKKQGVSHSTIKRRLLKLQDTPEFNTEVAIRNANKSIRNRLKNPMSLQEFDIETLCKENVKKVF